MADFHDVPDSKQRGDPLTAVEWNALARAAKHSPPQDGGDELVPFELKDDITPGGTDIEAWVLDEDLARDEDADTITVNDEILGDVRALGSDTKDGATPDTGARGFCVADVNGDNQIVAIQRLSKLCRATAKAAISGVTGTVDAVTVMDDGQSPVSSAAAELAVNNPWNYYVADDAICRIVRNGAGWEIVNVALVAETFETEEQVTGLTFQGKHREIRVNPTGAESAWTTWHTGDDCTA